jgi:hypothetical protein
MSGGVRAWQKNRQRRNTAERDHTKHSTASPCAVSGQRGEAEGFARTTTGKGSTPALPLPYKQTALCVCVALQL